MLAVVLFWLVAFVCSTIGLIVSKVVGVELADAPTKPPIKIAVRVLAWLLWPVGLTVAFIYFAISRLARKFVR